MFPSVIPLSGTDCSRVTHPSAARIDSVQAPPQSPLDLHVLSTPPAFVLSQDQTLMFNPYLISCLPLSSSPKPSSFPQFLRRFTLSESDCSFSFLLIVGSARNDFSFSSLYRFQGSLVVVPPSVFRCSRDNVDDYSKPPFVCQPFFCNFSNT